MARKKTTGQDKQKAPVAKKGAKTAAKAKKPIAKKSVRVPKTTTANQEMFKNPSNCTWWPFSGPSARVWNAVAPSTIKVEEEVMMPVKAFQGLSRPENHFHDCSSGFQKDLGRPKVAPSDYEKIEKYWKPQIAKEASESVFLWFLMVVVA